MSAPITRAFMEALAVRLDEWGATPNGRQIAIEIRKTLAAESASPPRAPGASAKLEADFREFIKKAEPGNLAELIETVACERGRRAVARAEKRVS